jgi:peptidoglycan/LPS O-acetylase OafA/YrhL
VPPTPAEARLAPRAGRAYRLGPKFSKKSEVADSSASAERRIDWLDYLRLLCAIMVVMTHYVVVVVPRIPGLTNTDLGLISDMASYGHIALFAFFIMSGMMIVQIVQRQKLSTFVTHRMTRVYPTFVVCLSLTSLLGIGELGRMHVGFWQYLANLTINAEALGYRPADASYWTLRVEIIFYAMIVAVAMLGWLRHIQAVVAVWIALQVVAAPFFPRAPLLGTDYYFLAAGCVMGLLYQRRNERLNLALLAVTALLGTRTIIIASRGMPFDPWIGIVLMMGVFVLFLAMRGSDIRLPWARRIGSFTYPLYLLHFKIGTIMLIWWATDANKWWLVAALLLGMILFSLVLDDIIEFRLRRMWRKLAMATVARPFALWEQRRLEAGMPAGVRS